MCDDHRPPKDDHPWRPILLIGLLLVIAFITPSEILRLVVLGFVLLGSTAYLVIITWLVFTTKTSSNNRNTEKKENNS